MPDNAGAAPAAPANGNERQTDWQWTIGRAILMYVGIQFVMGPNGPFASKKAAVPAPGPPAPAGSHAAISPASAVDAPELPAVLRGIRDTLPVWRQDALLDFYVYISSAPAPTHEDLLTQYSDLVEDGGLDTAPALPFDSFAQLLQDPVRPEGQVIYADGASTHSGDLKPIAAAKWSGIRLGDFAMKRDVDFLLKLDDGVRSNNGSIWADLVVTIQGVRPDSVETAPNNAAVFRSRKLLTRLLPLKKKREEKNLFAKGEDAEDKVAPSLKQEEEEGALIGYWHKNLTLALIQDDAPPIQLLQLPPPIRQHVYLPRSKDGSKLSDVSGHFDLRYPIVFPNDFWLLREHMNPINETVTELPLHINLYHQSWFKFQAIASMTEAFNKQTGGVTGNELDMFKTMLLETNPWFLALTVIVSLLHSLFEFLAFSSDVKHWKNKDNFAGVSVGSILTNVVVQIIITLYLLDNNEETSWMILAGQGVGMLIEIWKLTKAVTVGFVAAPAGSWLPYKLQISDKHVLSEEEKKTQEFDKLAFKYVGIVTVPVLVAYTIYSAVYETHRGWWSFIISTACSFVYAFGFVSLVPQLIVNYKLKSTAGMNHKTFVYKILGTFVDDLFAFCIKMPTLHRLACFRDDIVFFIFLYQRWIYGVDPTRRNEFGQVEAEKDAEGPSKEKESAVTSGTKEVKDATGLRARTSTKSG